MSFLLWDQQETSVTLVSDTLSTVNGQPTMFQSKVWTFPHLNMAMAVTGTANVGIAWHHRLIAEAVVWDIESVNAFAQSSLREIHASVDDSLGPSGSSTVYHFGFPRGSDQLVRYIYRSARDFEPERFVGDQCGYKPATFSFKLHDIPEGKDELVSFAVRVREENDNGDAPEPVQIGGELYATRLENGHIQTALWHQFPDYNDMARAMGERLIAHNTAHSQAASSDDNPTKAET